MGLQWDKPSTNWSRISQPSRVQDSHRIFPLYVQGIPAVSPCHQQIPGICDTSSSSGLHFTSGGLLSPEMVSMVTPFGPNWRKKKSVKHPFFWRVPYYGTQFEGYHPKFWVIGSPSIFSTQFWPINISLRRKCWRLGSMANPHLLTQSLGSNHWRLIQQQGSFVGSHSWSGLSFVVFSKEYQE